MRAGEKMSGKISQDFELIFLPRTNFEEVLYMFSGMDEHKGNNFIWKMLDQSTHSTSKFIEFFCESDNTKTKLLKMIELEKLMKSLKF